MSIMTHLDAQSQDTMNIRLIKLKEFNRRIEKQLDEAREEMDDVCSGTTTNVNIASERAFLHTREFLNEFITTIVSLSSNVNLTEAVPEILWLEGGLGLEWRPKGGIITVSIYGDFKIYIVALMDDSNYDFSAKFPLDDKNILLSYLQLLVNILYKGTTLENDIYFKQRDSDTIYFSEEEPILTNKDDSAL